LKIADPSGTASPPTSGSVHELVKGDLPAYLGAAKRINWLDHCGFWLEELNQHPRTPDQVPFMIGLLGLAVSREAGWPVHTATTELRNYMRLYQIRKEVL
jgi:hypothetical protein